MDQAADRGGIPPRPHANESGRQPDAEPRGAGAKRLGPRDAEPHAIGRGFGNPDTNAVGVGIRGQSNADAHTVADSLSDARGLADADTDRDTEQYAGRSITDTLANAVADPHGHAHADTDGNAEQHARRRVSDAVSHAQSHADADADALDDANTDAHPHVDADTDADAIDDADDDADTDANTVRLIRVAAVSDVTVVTCVARCLGHDFTEAVAMLQPLVGAGVPVLVYVDDVWKEALEERCQAEHVRLHESSPRRRLASFAFGQELSAAWASSSGLDVPGLDYFVALLSKMGMLHDQSIWNPFGTRHLLWIDADITSSVHGRYFTDERLLDLMPSLLRRFLFLTRPTAVADVAGTAGASRVQGQMFGGELADIGHANALYYPLLEDALRQGRLTTDESIFTQMIERCPERFDRFVLQDNGLASRLFEQMRTGHVALERTAVY